MKFLGPFSKGLFIAHSYTQTRSMTKLARPLPPKTPIKSPEAPTPSLAKVPEYELEANSYRKKISININDLDALYGLAKCLERGASVIAADMRITRSYWLGASSINIQAELYRRVLRFKSTHSGSIQGLAECLRKGAAPKIEDLCGTWLEGGNFMLDNGEWGLTKPVICLLAHALEERSKAIKLSLTQVAETTSSQKISPK